MEFASELANTQSSYPWEIQLSISFQCTPRNYNLPRKVFLKSSYRAEILRTMRVAYSHNSNTISSRHPIHNYKMREIRASYSVGNTHNYRSST